MNQDKGNSTLNKTAKLLMYIGLFFMVFVPFVFGPIVYDLFFERQDNIFSFFISFFGPNLFYFVFITIGGLIMITGLVKQIRITGMLQNSVKPSKDFQLLFLKLMIVATAIYVLHFAYIGLYPFLH